MAGKAMDVYLNDHLAGATLGIELAKLIRSRSQGTSLSELMAGLAPQIEQDRQTLIGLMQRIDSPRNPGKQAGVWLTGKASRVKFWGLTSGEPELGTFMALESLALGVQGKLSLWKALEQVADRHPALASVNLTELINRAQSQYDALEQARLGAGETALTLTHAVG
jgi:hypothetical protein